MPPAPSSRTAPEAALPLLHCHPSERWTPELKCASEACLLPKTQIQKQAAYRMPTRQHRGRLSRAAHLPRSPVYLLPARFTYFIAGTAHSPSSSARKVELWNIPAEVIARSEIAGSLTNAFPLAMHLS